MTFLNPPSSMVTDYLKSVYLCKPADIFPVKKWNGEICERQRQRNADLVKIRRKSKRFSHKKMIEIQIPFLPCKESYLTAIKQQHCSNSQVLTHRPVRDCWFTFLGKLKKSDGKHQSIKCFLHIWSGVQTWTRAQLKTQEVVKPSTVKLNLQSLEGKPSLSWNDVNTETKVSFFET